MADLSVNVTQDTIRLRDFVLGAALGVALSAGLMEQPRVTDTVTASMDISTQGQDFTEGCRPRDRVYGATTYVQSQNQLEAGLYEGHVKVADTVTPALQLATSLTEVCRPRDWVYGARAFIPANELAAGLLEGPVKVIDIGYGEADIYGPGAKVHAQEFGQVTLFGPGAWVKVDDSQVTAQLVASPDLSVTVTQEVIHCTDGSALQELLNPLQTSSSTEALHCVDSVLGPTLDPEQTSSPAELLHVTDTVLGSTLTPLQTLGFDELVHVQDAVTGPTLNPLLTSGFDELVHCQDTVTATISGGASVSELVHCTDTVVGVLLNPLQTSGFDELLHVQDTLSTLLNPLQASGFDELVHVNDSDVTGVIGQDEIVHCVDQQPIAGLTPVFASGFDELLHVQDTVTAALSSGTSLQESVKCADLLVAVLLNPEQTSGFDELVHVTDGAPLSTLLNPEQASGFDELLHVQDSVSAQLGGGAASVAEAEKSADLAPLVTLDPEQVQQAESCRVQDTVSASLTVLQTQPTELLHCQDLVAGAAPTPIFGSASELLHCTDGPASAASAFPRVMPLVLTWDTVRSTILTSTTDRSTPLLTWE